jgi:hypothetical protein
VIREILKDLFFGCSLKVGQNGFDAKDFAHVYGAGHG